MPIAVNQGQREKYILNVSFTFKNIDNTENFIFNKKQIIRYEVLKDSMLRNHNIHLMTIASVPLNIFQYLKQKETIINITLSDTEKVLHTNTYRIFKNNIVEEMNDVSTIQLWMISLKVESFLESSKYGLSLDTNSHSLYLTSHQLLLKILQNMSSNEGSDFDYLLTSSGEIKNIYKDIRIPEQLNDLEIFEYIFNNYPPYYISPYFLFDDFYFSNIISKKYNMILTSLIDINGSYIPSNIINIEGLGLNGYKFVTSKPIFNYLDVYQEVQATLMIKNSNENRLFELKPESLGNRSNQVIQLESPLSIENFKKKLYIKKKLADSEATIETYKLGSIKLGSVTFNHVYNIKTSSMYDHIPLSIHYTFILSGENYYDLETEVEFARVPVNILAT